MVSLSAYLKYKTKGDVHMDKLKKYLDDLLEGEGKAIINKEDVQEVLPRLEAVLDETGCIYSWSENMEGMVLVIITSIE